MAEKCRSEHCEQVDFVAWFRKKHPDVLIFAIPNGGSRGKAEAARLKKEGVTRGIPDLFIPEWCVWVEMKRVKGGSLSKDQREVINYLNGLQAHLVIVANGFEDAKKQILEIAG
jgi:hypothetical protein